MKRRRVVVTGMGVVSCFGSDVEKFYDNLLAGNSGIVKAPEHLQEYPCKVCAPVAVDFDVSEYINPKEARRIDPFMRYGIVAGKKALENANLKETSNLDKSRCGVMIGSGMGGMQTYETGLQARFEKGYKAVTPFFVPYTITNSAGAMLAIEIGFTGPNYSVSTACATGNYAIDLAAKHIQRGDCDLILAGGVEAPICPVGFTGFSVLKAISTLYNETPSKASRPWDNGRDGFVIGDGAGVLVLEELEHAKARGATILAEYLGGAFTCDASHMTSPDPEGKGVAHCIKLALKDARVKAKDVTYINAHATSTSVGDECEINGLKKVFGSRLKEISVNATKGMIGHPLGAASGIEAVVVVSAIKTGMLHPSVNLDDPAPFIEGMDVVAGQAKPFRKGVVLSNSFGFGGHNSVAVFAPFKE